MKANTLTAFSRYSACLALAGALLAPSASAQEPQVQPMVPNAVALQVEPFSLNQVQLLDSPFKAAMERNVQVLLGIDPDRLLHNTRQYAGLTPKAPIYGGWESAGIAGHTLGHYLTALSQQYAATGDPRFKARVDYIVSEMSLCQKAYGDGYIGALPPLELKTLRDLKYDVLEVKGGGFKSGAWVPWYTEHKVLAGLKDAWVLTGNQQAKDVTLRLADWMDEITSPLTHDQMQQMLGVEHGGMCETLTEIYALTGNKKYLDLAQRFVHEAIVGPLLAGRDELGGKHANTQIPKIIGQARLYEITGNPDNRTVSENFWNAVVQHHTYIIGGNSDSEYFDSPDKLSDHLDPSTCDTCNTYNMLKLTRHLFEWDPRVEYADFYERALLNDIMAAQDPKDGMYTYFMSLKPGHFRTFSTPDKSFWCCFGTGMENYTKLNDSIFFHDDTSLFVNLFIPAHLRWEAKGLTLDQETSYPQNGSVELHILAAGPEALGLKIRCPQWAEGGLKFSLNGKPLAVASTPGQYAEVRRVWRAGDVLGFSVPLTVRVEKMTDAPNKVAFLYGPLVLAGDFGPETPDQTVPYAGAQWDNLNKPAAEVPLLVSDTDVTPAQVHRAAAKDLVFQLPETGGGSAVTLRPFYGLYFDRTSVYFDVLNSAEYARRKVALQAEAAHQRELTARTLDEFDPGRQQSEVDHKFQGQNSNTGPFNGRNYRDATDGWFSFVARVAPDVANQLEVTYWGNDGGGRTFDILVDGQAVATQALNKDKPGEFWEKDYDIPTELTHGKTSVTVRFQAHPGNVAGGIFGAKMLKPAS